MKATLITIDLKPRPPLKQEYTGGIFRGWLGYILKCHPLKKCESCESVYECPYYMVFKEQTDIKPYSLLSFETDSCIRNFIRIFGERRRFAPEILARIEERNTRVHFGGSAYKITALEARNISLPSCSLGNKTTIHFITPVALVDRQRLEIIPPLNLIIKSTVRAYNRVTKYYDQENYPYRVGSEILAAEAPVIDFEVKENSIVHQTMEKKKILMHGISGWVRYDTEKCPPGTGDVLKIGEFLQIGKHTTYGFGGILVATGDAS